jgi:hypothetical protein
MQKFFGTNFSFGTCQPKAYFGTRYTFCFAETRGTRISVQCTLWYGSTPKIKMPAKSREKRTKNRLEEDSRADFSRQALSPQGA